MKSMPHIAFVIVLGTAMFGVVTSYDHPEVETTFDEAPAVLQMVDTTHPSTTKLRKTKPKVQHGDQRDQWTDGYGRFHLGNNRRRAGAGFGRRRRRTPVAIKGQRGAKMMKKLNSIKKGKAMRRIHSHLATVKKFYPKRKSNKYEWSMPSQPKDLFRGKHIKNMWGEQDHSKRVRQRKRRFLLRLKDKVRELKVKIKTVAKKLTNDKGRKLRKADKSWVRSLKRQERRAVSKFQTLQKAKGAHRL